MKVSSNQISELSKAKIRQMQADFERFFLDLFEKGVLIYDFKLPFKDYLNSLVEDALRLNILNEQGVVKYAFLFLSLAEFVNSQQIENLKISIGNTTSQRKKNEVIEEFFYAHTGFDTYWKS